jgi:hypothetical protein
MPVRRDLTQFCGCKKSLFPAGATQAIAFDVTQPSLSDGITMLDESGNGNDARLIDAPSLTFVDAGTTIIAVPVAAAVASRTVIGFSFWARFTDAAASNDETIYGESKDGASGTLVFNILRDSATSKIQVRARDDTDSVSDLLATNTTGENVWVHIAGHVDFTNDDMQLWINGSSEDSTTGMSATTFWSAANDPPNIGAHGNGSLEMDGQIVDFRMYTTRLSDTATPTVLHSDVASIGTSKRGKVDDLLWWYWIMEGAGTTIYDAGDNGYDGTLTLGGGSWTNDVNDTIFLPAYYGWHDVIGDGSVIQPYQDAATPSHAPGVHNDGGYKIDFTDGGANTGGSSDATYEFGDGDGATLNVGIEQTKREAQFSSTSTQYLLFDGSGDFVTLPQTGTDIVDYSVAWELTCDMIVVDSGANRTLASSATTTFDPRFTGGDLLDVFCGGTTNGVNAWRNQAVSLVFATWFTFKLTWDGVDQMEVFFDDVSQATKTISTPVTPAGTATISKGGSTSWDGGIQNYKMTESGVVKYHYKFHGDATDEGPNSWDGTVSNATFATRA